MPSLETLQHRISLTQDLQAVVKTMKTLAAASIRQYERAVESLADYTDTIEIGLQAVLPHSPSPPRMPPRPTGERIGVVIFGSDQGMCGQFNQQIAHHGLTQLLPTHPDGYFLALGARVVPPLELAGRVVAETLTMPTSLTGITTSVQSLLVRLETLLAQPSPPLSTGQPPSGQGRSLTRGV